MDPLLKDFLILLNTYTELDICKGFLSLQNSRLSEVNLFEFVISLLNHYFLVKDEIFINQDKIDLNL